MFSMHDDGFFKSQALEKGAKSFISKTLSASQISEQLEKALKEVWGENPCLDSDSVLQNLSNQERLVLQGLLANKSLKEISAELNLAYTTVQTYKKRIFEKLGLNNSLDFAEFCIKHQLKQ